MFPWADVGELRTAAQAGRGFRDELRPPFRAVATFAVGFAAFLGGEDETARVELERAVELGTMAHAWIIVVDALGVGAQVALSQGRVEDAERQGLSVLEHARIHGLLDLPHVGYYLATLGVATARCGRLEQGDELLDAGIRQLAEWDPLLAGHARLMRAPVRRQLGDLGGARALLDEATSLLALCHDTGVIGDLAMSVARTLSTSHRRGDERTDLTDREMDVLRLLANGCPSARSRTGCSCRSTRSTHTRGRSTTDLTLPTVKRRSSGPANSTCSERAPGGPLCGCGQRRDGHARRRPFRPDRRASPR